MMIHPSLWQKATLFEQFVCHPSTLSLAPERESTTAHAANDGRKKLNYHQQRLVSFFFVATAVLLIYHSRITKQQEHDISQQQKTSCFYFRLRKVIIKYFLSVIKNLKLILIFRIFDKPEFEIRCQCFFLFMINVKSRVETLGITASTETLVYILERRK
jgi:hypothetical protein